MGSNQKKQSVIDKDLLNFVWKQVKKHPVLATTTGASMTLLGLAGTAFPWLMGLSSSMLASAAMPAAVTTTAWWAGAFTLCAAHPALQITLGLVRSASNRMTDLFNSKIAHHILRKNTQRMMNLPPLVKQQKTEQELHSAIQKNTSSLQKITRELMCSSQQIVAWISSTIALSVMYAPLAASIGGLALGKTWLSHKLHKKLQTYQDEYAKLDLFSRTQNGDILVNSDRLRAMGFSEKALNEQDKTNAEIIKIGKRLKRLTNLINITNGACDMATSFVILGGSLLNFYHTRDLTMYFAVTGCSFTALMTTSGIIDSAMSLQSAYQDYTATDKAFDYDRSLDRQMGEKELGQVKGHIQFRDVSFAYPAQKDNGRGTPIFENFNLSIQPGEHVAIIGASGTGKSTLVSLLAHTYEIQGGSIQIDGTDIRDVTEESLNKNIHYIQQEPRFFKGKSIEENLTYYNPDATQEDIEIALKRANLYDELKQKEDYLNGKVTALSPGQQQRLALAEAFLSNAPIIVLDEPTSKLDVEAQSDVLKALQEFGQDKTIISISHIPAEINNASRVLILKDGKIIEDGNPHELIHQEGSIFRSRYGLYESLFSQNTAAPQPAQAMVTQQQTVQSQQATRPAEPIFIRSHPGTREAIVRATQNEAVHTLAGNQ